jgi:histone deacetylase complex regulatory component SIN3
MLDPTEGVPHSRVGKPFLRRNLAKDVDVNTILSDDRQELRVDVTTYRIIFTYHGTPGKPFVYEKKISKNEVAYAEERLKKEKAKRDERMKEKIVTNAAWTRRQSKDEVERRKAAWQMGLDEGLWKMEESLIGLPANEASSGDAMAVDARI